MSIAVYILIGAYVIDHFLSQAQRKHITHEEYSRLYDEWRSKLGFVPWVVLAAAVFIIQSEQIEERIIEISVLVAASMLMAFGRYRDLRNIKKVNIQGDYREYSYKRLYLAILAMSAISISYAI